MAQRYDTYKDSGVQWLGKIPGHWEVIRNKWLFKEEDEKNSDLSYQLLSFSRSKGIIPFSDNTDKAPSASDLSKYKILHKGQLLENRMQAWSGMFGCSHIEGCVSPDYSVFSPINGANTEYYAHLYRTPLYILQFANASKGIGDGFNRLYTPQFNKIYATCPPLPEQHAIVSYLDDKCGKIDEWIEKKLKEVELLGEMKQRVIADAVTRGLNPDVKMKPTNNICLGEVPEHWQIVRYGTLFKLKPVKQHHEEELLSVFLNFGVIRASESDKRTHAASEDLSKYQLVEPTDFVMNNQQAWRGSVGVSKLIGIISPAYHIFIMPTCFDAEYANALLRSKAMVGQFEMSSRGVGSIQRTLNFNWLNNKLVPLPPLSEQHAIVSYITERTAKIDRMVENINNEIENLKEYKQRLISDVVTGQIKVC